MKQLRYVQLLKRIKISLIFSNKKIEDFILSHLKSFFCTSGEKRRQGCYAGGTLNTLGDSSRKESAFAKLVLSRVRVRRVFIMTNTPDNGGAGEGVINIYFITNKIMNIIPLTPAWKLGSAKSPSGRQKS
jgi:hypothetical protein